jgi:hypothetical protein
MIKVMILKPAPGECECGCKRINGFFAISNPSVCNTLCSCQDIASLGKNKDALIFQEMVVDLGARI